MEVLVGCLGQVDCVTWERLSKYVDSARTCDCPIINVFSNSFSSSDTGMDCAM